MTEDKEKKNTGYRVTSDFHKRLGHEVLERGTKMQPFIHEAVEIYLDIKPSALPLVRRFIKALAVADDAAKSRLENQVGRILGVAEAGQPQQQRGKGNAENEK